MMQKQTRPIHMQNWCLEMWNKSPSIVECPYGWVAIYGFIMVYYLTLVIKFPYTKLEVILVIPVNSNCKYTTIILNIEDCANETLYFFFYFPLIKSKRDAVQSADFQVNFL